MKEFNEDALHSDSATMRYLSEGSTEGHNSHIHGSGKDAFLLKPRH